jgi:hypothetical protein
LSRRWRSVILPVEPAGLREFSAARDTLDRIAFGVALPPPASIVIDSRMRRLTLRCA